MDSQAATVVKHAHCQKCGGPVRIPKRGPIAAICDDCKTRKCKTCGVPVAKMQRHCEPCKAIANILTKATVRTEKKVGTCLDCGEPIIRGSIRCRPCADAVKINGRLERQKRKCEHCGKTFVRNLGNNAGLFCSRECSFAANGRYYRQAEELKAKRSKARTDRLWRSLAVCLHCNLAFASKNGRLTCSNICRDAKAVQDAQNRYPEKTCNICGKDTGWSSKATKYQVRPSRCEACNMELQRVARARVSRRRKARQNGVTATSAPQAIVRKLNELMSQHGTTCPCCGLLMSRAISPNHPRRLEVDHIIPLAKGGTDTFDNVQPLCRTCNGLKSDWLPLLVTVQQWIRKS